MFKFIKFRLENNELYTGVNRDCVAQAKLNKESPRSYCQSHDKQFKQAHNDLVNLFPAVGQINADRSNKEYSLYMSDVKYEYGSCETESGKNGFKPPASMRGDIARVAFYMQEKYSVEYSHDEQQLFILWDKQDPISQEERDRNNRIIQVQGFGLQQ